MAKRIELNSSNPDLTKDWGAVFIWAAIKKGDSYVTLFIDLDYSADKFTRQGWAVPARGGDAVPKVTPLDKASTTTL
jgi:hypothetical protein